MPKLCQTEYACQRQALLEKGLQRLLESRNYQDITIKDICQEADIPRRTFYHYFDSKEDALDAVIDDMMRKCFLSVMFDFQLGREKMQQSFETVFRFWTGENQAKLDVLMRSGLESRLIAWASRWVRKELDGFIQRTGIDQKLAEIGIMVGINDFFTLLFYWNSRGYQETPEQMAEYAIQVLPQFLFNL